MATFPNAVQAQPFALAGAGAIIGATSITLQSFKQIDGTTDLAMADFGVIGYGTLEPGNSTLEEQISFSGVVQNSNGTATLTGVKTVLFTTPYTETSGLAKTHAGSTTFVISNDSGFYNSIKGYIDAAIITGSVPATDSVPGISILATSTQINAGTATETYLGTPYPLVVTPDQLLLSNYFNFLPTTTQKDALAGTGTPSSTNPYTNTDYLPIGRKSLTAGATINGATLPVPIYQDSTSFKVLACDGNDTATLKFIGFAVSNSTDTNPITVQTEGIVAGFTGLTRGVPYYVQDAVGTIGATPGTNEVLVGWAISTTEISILKGKRYASGTTTFTSTTTTAITTGFRPSRVRINATGFVSTATAECGYSNGGWTVAGSNDCVYGAINTGGATTAGTATTAYRLQVQGGTVYHSGTITTITATGFTIGNTETTDNMTANIFWEAEGDI